MTIVVLEIITPKTEERIPTSLEKQQIIEWTDNKNCDCKKWNKKFLITNWRDLTLELINAYIQFLVMIGSWKDREVVIFFLKVVSPALLRGGDGAGSEISKKRKDLFSSGVMSVQDYLFINFFSAQSLNQ